MAEPKTMTLELSYDDFELLFSVAYNVGERLAVELLQPQPDRTQAEMMQGAKHFNRITAIAAQMGRQIDEVKRG